MCVCVKSLQSCPTLCDPMDCSLTGSSVHGDSPGKNTGVGCHALLQGIFPTKGSNPSLLCLLHWQACSLPLVPPGKPRKVYIIVKLLKCKGVTNVEIRIVDTSESLWRVLWLGHVLVHLGCDNKNIIDQWLKQQTFIFHSSGDWEIQEQSTSRFDVARGPASWFIDNHLYTLSSQGRRDKGALWGLSCKGTAPIHEGFTLMT